ncbi:hypothetical protein ACFWNK_34000 [Streptomyces sp. NPDC058417]
MSDKKPDLTSPKAVAKSQEIYRGITAGRVQGDLGVLDKTHGTET